MTADTKAHNLSDIYLQVQLGGEHFHQCYWDPDYDMTTLNRVSSADKSQMEHSAQQHYLAELIKFMPIQKGHTILDLGCGAGGTAIWLAKKFGCNVYGIDIVEENITQAKERVKKAQLEHLIQVEQSDALAMDFPAQMFDHAICVEAIHHIKDKKRLFAKLHHVLKPEGHLVFSDYMLEKPCSWLLNLVASEVVESKYMAGINEYRKMLMDAGFVKVDERNAGENTISKLVEFQKSTHFREIKYAFGKTFLSCAMISIFAPVFADSMYKGVRDNKFQLNFVSYTKN